MTALIVAADRIVTGIGSDDEPKIVEGAAILTRDGTIVAIAPLEDLRRQAPDAPVRHHPGRAMLPGFVNAHHHVGLTPLQLGSPDHPLELWFASRLVCRRIDAELDTLYSAFEMLASGVTTEASTSRARSRAATKPCVHRRRRSLARTGGSE